MIALNTPLKNSATPTHIFAFIQPTSLLRFTLLFILVATPVLLGMLPSQAEANYSLSAQIGDHTYSLPAYCESVSANLSHCTPLGTLPLTSEASSSARVTAIAFQGLGERLECVGTPGTFFYCHSPLSQLSSLD